MSTLYFDSLIREQYLTEIDILSTMTAERLFSQFSNVEGEVEEYRTHLEGTKDNRYATKDICEMTYEYYEILSLMRYRTIGMCLCILYQLWEQQLFCFIKREALSDGIEIEQDCNFSFLKNTLIQYKYDFNQNKNNWEKINELRLLSNTIKHAEGKSERELMAKYRDTYAMDWKPGDGISAIELFHNSLRQENLKVSVNDYNVFVSSIQSFWETFPEWSYVNESEQ